MEPIKLERLLIASDSLDGMPVALDKAAVLEHYTGAELLALLAVYDRVAEEPQRVLPAERQAELIEAFKAAERRGLEAVAGAVRDRVASLDTQVVWQPRASDAILDTAKRWRADLLIKPVCEHHPVADYFHTPADWALMRDAGCPVLISKRANWKAPYRVLAALDIADTEHAPLNDHILMLASTLANLLEARLHIATAYPDLGQRVDALQVATDFEGIKASMRDNRRTDLVDALARLDIGADEVHVLEGRPAVVIAALAQRLDATITVVGTAARRGLSKLVIGNTAEDIIARVPGDLLTVREP
jgi:universal stress protein E